MDDVPDIGLNAPLKIDDLKEKVAVSPLEKNGKYVYLAGVFFVVMVIALTAFLYFVFQDKLVVPQSQDVVIKIQTPVPYSINKGDLTLEVLNGTKTTGVAKKAADSLISNGFNVIRIGNAESKSFTGTKVYISEKYNDQSYLLLNLIQSVMPNATLSGVLTDSSASGRIIVGSN